MSGQPKYRSFAIKAGLILVMGIVIMSVVTGGIVLATSPGGTAAGTTVVSSNNTAGSYGITGYQAVSVDPKATGFPGFIKNALAEKRGVVLLVYVKGSTDDQQMLDAFNALKAKYADQGAFFSFESRKASQLGVLLSQLKISQPPALAVISPDGKVYQEYTGWIAPRVMEQVVANGLNQ
jgi:hypothetical protein